MQEATKDQVNKMTTDMIQSANDVNMMLHDSMKAGVQSMSIMVQGYSDLCDSLTSLMQKSIEQTATISQNMMNVNSVDELVNTQNDLIKNSFESMVSEMNNITQISGRIAQQAAEPMTKQMNDAMNKMSSKVQAA